MNKNTNYILLGKGVVKKSERKPNFDKGRNYYLHEQIKGKIEYINTLSPNAPAL